MGELYDKEYKEGTKKFLDETKEAAEAYKQYQKALSDTSPFDKKTNELIMVAVSAALQCDYCIETHSKRAKLAGATDKEIAFAVHLAASVKHGATVSYGVKAL
ncbi:TPA: carboxymuconolactone decarboxylase family protein [Candidatus Woesearchaeota archaeon]|nr:Alkylhydroperoxidase AhpD core [archaeon GW2011_AR15]MBS3104078.1 carboxymuconolactone decarboxylase family protein [Candidatus Woesearchaeota archaeon]HIH41670.1 carboxymuconolactone decarboxylase family protein [Candidatus Woesearchaeota archaeon]